MTRIIGGRMSGRRLATPSGEATRPTSDRVREALFSTLESWFGGLDGLAVLDLYAGSGALGLEAGSRGASYLVAVESDRATAGLVQQNAAALGARVDVVVQPVARFLATTPTAPVDLVLMDPPYPLTEEELAGDLRALAEGGWLAADALVVVERSARSPEPRWPAGISRLSGKRGERRYGETVLWYGRANPPADPSAAPIVDQQE